MLRLKTAVAAYRPGASLSQISLDAGYFDQSHFIRDFKSVTGESPIRFFKSGKYC